MRMSKVWQHQDHKDFSLLIPRDREKNFTVYGAISTAGEFVYDIGRSTNKHETEQFIRKWFSDEQGSLMVLDNHRAHTCERLEEFFEELEVETHFLPKCASELSPVEKIWDMMKQSWKKITA